MECISRKVGYEFPRSGRPDLKLKAFTPDLVARAADAIADLFEQEGFHLSYSNESGNSVHQSFYSSNPCDQLVHVEFSLVQVEPVEQSISVELAIRDSAPGAFSKSRSTLVYSGVIHIAGAWLSALKNDSGAAQFISALTDKAKPKSLCMRNFLSVDAPIPVKNRLGGIYA